MNVTLTSATQKLLEERMQQGQYSTPDDALQDALRTLRDIEAHELDDETLAAIEDGLAQANRGEVRPWEDVREELRAKYVKK
jgi:Arc/MetJ-type ribon-helix-helix transcriptional regulator